MSNTRAPIAFFGATGGCTLAALVLTLNAGIDCRALARTPQKLLDMLGAQGVTSELITKHLVIIEGDAKALEEGLLGRSFAGHLRHSLDDLHVCHAAMSTILLALSSTPYQPSIIAISTTGISTIRDVPYLLMPLYRLLLAVPHQDKTGMEKVLVDSGGKWTLVRPTLLMDGDGEGKVLRVGWEGEGGQPEMGYCIGRGAVGKWIFDELMQNEARREQWVGRKATLTW